MEDCDDTLELEIAGEHSHTGDRRHRRKETHWIQVSIKQGVLEVRRLKSHPSVVIWSGNNENEAAIAADWFNISAAERPLYVRDYVSLYIENIRDLVLQEDGTRPFLVSSPTNGVESVKEGWVAHDPYDPHYGDTHYYSYYNDWTAFPHTRFASEDGFQSWPSFSTLKFGGKWKMLHYWAADFYAPVLSVAVEDEASGLVCTSLAPALLTCCRAPDEQNHQAIN
ncbi:Beta-mannosidase [Anabarilius grahami]|uniref:Beta-mannosidase n=1 Tax=Anabarilius grahami TaxID=495550 RepID=A0A3N0XPH7_ANAGA|nr:Beta-mannosidase [Anabarilius grahami]